MAEQHHLNTHFKLIFSICWFMVASYTKQIWTSKKLSLALHIDMAVNLHRFLLVLGSVYYLNQLWQKPHWCIYVLPGLIQWLCSSIWCVPAFDYFLEITKNFMLSKIYFINKYRSIKWKQLILYRTIRTNNLHDVINQESRIKNNTALTQDGYDHWSVYYCLSMLMSMLMSIHRKNS